MEATLQALADILLRAVPTFFVVIFLYFYLRAMFFKPFAKLLGERHAATEGARRQAAASIEEAAHKAAAYDESLHAARNEIYREHEEIRRKWREEQSIRIMEARKRADALVRDARAQLASEAEQAKQNLLADSRTLADQIVRRVLAGAAQ